MNKQKFLMTLIRGFQEERRLNEGFELWALIIGQGIYNKKISRITKTIYFSILLFSLS
jgi:pentatricopeptide repeat protein